MFEEGIHFGGDVYKVCFYGDVLNNPMQNLQIHKVRAHVGNTRTEIVDTLANEGTLKEKPTTTPHIHIAHPTPY